MINELITGFGLMFESWARIIKMKSVIIAFVSIFALLGGHFSLNYYVRNKKTKQMVSLLIALLVALLCILAFAKYYEAYSRNYNLLADGIPADLKTHYVEALRDELYASFESDTAETDLWYNGIPPAWTPPAYAFLRWSNTFMGRDFELYSANYKKLGLGMISAVLALLIGYTAINLDGKSRLGMVIIASFINILFLLIAFTSDRFLGNANIFVAFCISVQLFLTRWENRYSMLLQGFLLALAWWCKPNIALVLLSLFIFSLHRKQYAYLGGMIAGVVMPVMASLFSSNITFGTYLTFFGKISKGIEVNALGHPANLSVFNLFSNPALAYKLAFLLVSLFMILYITKTKDGTFFRYEMLSFSLTYLVWTSLWSNYLIPLSIIFWGYMIIRIQEKQPVYFLCSMILVLVWMAYFKFSIIGVNLALLLCAVHILLDKVSYDKMPGLTSQNVSI